MILRGWKYSPPPFLKGVIKGHFTFVPHQRDGINGVTHKNYGTYNKKVLDTLGEIGDLPKKKNCLNLRAYH